MIDYRIKTFMTLYETMNYHKTAELLNMTQPAVTQHIKYLENLYNIKLFTYENKKLKLTNHAISLHQYAQQANYLNDCFLNSIYNNKMRFRLGASKSIGNYLINNQIAKLTSNDSIDFSLTILNTEQLLTRIDEGLLDIALVEGYFNKNEYGHTLYKHENFVGICSCDHRFANKEISLDELFNELFLCREKGSGSRDILNKVLMDNNYTIDCFKEITYISSIEVIKSLVEKNIGISFVYKSIINQNDKISFFTIKDIDIVKEFNFVYLKIIDNKQYLNLFK